MRSSSLTSPPNPAPTSRREILRRNVQGSCWLAGCWSGSYDQGGNECGEQGFAATACVVHELEEAEVVRQLLLRDPAVRAQPGAQQGSLLHGSGGWRAGMAGVGGRPL